MRSASISPPTTALTFGVKGEVGTVSDPLAGDLTRHALGLSAAYRFQNLKYSGNAERRDDDSSLSGKRTTWLVRNTMGYQATPAWRLLGKANWSTSSNTQGAFYDGDFHEYAAGAAYRPVDNDRWNTLIKIQTSRMSHHRGSWPPVAGWRIMLSAARCLPSIRSTIWFRGCQWGRSMVIASVSSRRPRPMATWFSSRADLDCTGADFHWVREWDAVVEARQLRAQEAGDARSGFLVAAYRHLDKGVKAGIGYNFTNFSDDLT